MTKTESLTEFLASPDNFSKTVMDDQYNVMALYEKMQLFYSDCTMSEPRFIVVTGKNGSGKTRFLQKINKHRKLLGIEAICKGIEEFRPDKRPSKTSINTVIKDRDKDIESLKMLFDDKYVNLCNELQNIVKSSNNLNAFFKSFKEWGEDSNDEKSQIVFTDSAKNFLFDLLKSEGEKNDHQLNDEWELQIRKQLLKKYDILSNNKVNEPLQFIYLLANIELSSARGQLSSWQPGSDLLLYQYYKANLGDQEVNSLELIDFLQNLSSNKEDLASIVREYIISTTDLKNIENLLNKTLEELSYKYKITFEYDNEFRDLTVKFIDVKDKNKVFISDMDLQYHGNSEDNTPKIELSSGESSILYFAAYQFLFSEYSTSSQKKLLILDEPDRHLDPELCRQFMKLMSKIFPDLGISVVMTTHRIDSLALVPDSPNCSIFNISTQNDGNYLLQKTHKIEALANLTVNLHHFTNFGVKVYVEALKDKYFYELIYTHLKRHATRLIEEGVVLPEELPKGFENLSDKYHLHFHGTGGEDNSQGGCAVVKKMVKHSNDVSSKTFLDSGYSNVNAPLFNLFRAYGIDKPFGIIDRDQDTSPSKNDRIIKLQRYSVENFLFDPILVHGINNDGELLTQNQLNSIFATIKANADINIFLQSYYEEFIYPKSLKNLSIELYTTDKENNKIKITYYLEDGDIEKKIEKTKDLQKKNKNNKNNLKITCYPAGEDTKQKIEKSENKLIQQLLEQLENNLSLEQSSVSTSISMKVGDNKNPYIFNCKMTNFESDKKRNNYKYLVDAITAEPEKKITICILTKEHEIKTREYPEWFINKRGHDIHKLLRFMPIDYQKVSEEGDKLLKELQLSALQETKLLEKMQDLIFDKDKYFPIPTDLIESIVDCNNKMLAQIYEVVKSGEYVGSDALIHVSDHENRDQGSLSINNNMLLSIPECLKRKEREIKLYIKKLEGSEESWSVLRNKLNAFFLEGKGGGWPVELQDWYNKFHQEFCHDEKESSAQLQNTEDSLEMDCLLPNQDSVIDQDQDAKIAGLSDDPDNLDSPDTL